MDTARSCTWMLGGHGWCFPTSTAGNKGVGEVVGVSPRVVVGGSHCLFVMCWFWPSARPGEIFLKSRGVTPAIMRPEVKAHGERD
jgi:hypothetical protein